MAGSAIAAPQEPFDPVMGLFFSQSQISFEKAPATLVDSCHRPSRSAFWIYAQTATPQGTFMVIAGPVWVTPDAGSDAKPELNQVDSYGEVILVSSGVCKPFADPDTLFNSPAALHDPVVAALARNLIDRAVRAYGGDRELLAALKAQTLTSADLPPVLRPMIEALRTGGTREQP